MHGAATFYLKKKQLLAPIRRSAPDTSMKPGQDKAKERRNDDFCKPYPAPFKFISEDG
jgi:hypothetical protein